MLDQCQLMNSVEIKVQKRWIGKGKRNTLHKRSWFEEKIRREAEEYIEER